MHYSSIKKGTYIIFITIVSFIGCIQDNLDDEPIIQTFKVFWKDFDLFYPYFSVHKVDWDSVYNASLSELRRDPLANKESVFANIIFALADHHVYLVTEHGVYSNGRDFDGINNISSNIETYAEEVEALSESIVYATLRDGTRYIYISSFNGNLASTTISKLTNRLKGKNGVIIDVRFNGGGNELNAFEVVRLFADTSRIFRWVQFRNGPDRISDFTDPIPSFTPFSDNLVLVPTVVLTNEGCQSACEGFVLAMKSLPHVTTIGERTAGSTGNPVMRELPNGWRLFLSSWLVKDLSGQIIEGNGIEPDILIKDSLPTDSKDIVLEGALEMLKN